MRLIGQSLAQSLLLACIGGACGLGLATVAVRLFTAWNPLGVLPAAPVGIDLRSLVFAVAITGAAAVLCGIAPALRTAATDPNEALRTGGDRGSSTAFGRWSQTGLLAAQVAASVVLLVAMVLLVRSFARLQNEPLGFDVSNLTVAGLALPTVEFDSGDARHAFFERLAERLGALPGVRRTAAATVPLLSAGAPVIVQTRTGDDEAGLRVPVQDVTLAVGGCAAAMVLAAGLEAVLYGVRPGDLVSFTAALAALLIVAAGAAFAAALRATRISPVDVLRGN